VAGEGAENAVTYAKMQDSKLKDKIAAHEIAGHETLELELKLLHVGLTNPLRDC